MLQDLLPESRIPDAPELTVAWTDGSRMCLFATGEWDLAAADHLARFIETLAAGANLLRIDLGEVAFLDCACLQVLVDVHNRLDAVGGSLVLSGLSGSVARLIKLAGVSDMLYVTRVSDRGDRADPLELLDLVPG